MDFRTPVEALIPGAQGRILAALLHADDPLPIRHLARLAGVSPNQGALVVRRLHELGLVDRTEAGTASLVALVSESPVVVALRKVADLRTQTLEAWRSEARRLDLHPAMLLVYGSWARGTAGPGSDVDVLAVLPSQVDEHDADRMRRALGRWTDSASRVAGLPVSLVVLDPEEVEHVSDSFRREATRDGVVLLGHEPQKVLHAT